MRKIIVAVLLILIILAAGWLWFRDGASESEPPINNVDSGDGGLFFPSGQVDNTPVGNLSVGDNLGVGNNDGNAGGTINTSFNFSKVSSAPIAGSALIVDRTNNTASSSPSLALYMDKATGHLYTFNPDNFDSPRQITNTTIPKVEQFFAGQSNNGLVVLSRYLKDERIYNFAANLINGFSSSTDPFTLAEGEIAELRGDFLSPNIREMAVAPERNRLFYLEQNANRETGGYTSDLLGQNKTLVFTSALTEWLVTWPTENIVALQTKSAFDIDGSLYLLDLTSKNTRFVFGGIPGLSTLLSPSGRKTLYSGNSSRGLAFGIYTLNDGLFYNLPVSTLAEKCVWSKNNVIVYCAVPQRLPAQIELPDNWYSGEVSFADNIWKIDTETKQAEIVYNPEIARLGRNIDGINLFLNEDETILFLTNKVDQHLWALNLEPGF